MLAFNDEGFPTDALSKDLMDSSVRAGILMMTGVSNLAFDVMKYEKEPGVFIRGPDRGIASNQNNNTRDQMLPLMAGFLNHGLHEPIKRFFYKRLEHGFLMQNIQRDKWGSVKMFRPHAFYKDSNPNTDTVPMRFNWKKFRFEISPGDLNFGETETRIIDGPDLLFLNAIGAMILVGNVYAWTPLLLFCYPAHIIGLIFHSFKKDTEQNQMISECYVYGTLKLFKKVCRNWEAQSADYWGRRKEIEYHELLKKMIDSV